MTATTTRRSVLAASGILAGVGVGAGVRHVVADPEPTGASATPLVVWSRNARIARPGARPGSMPERGTPSLPYGDLVSATGEVVGSFDTSQLAGSRGAMHLQRVELAGGTVVGLGAAGVEGVFTVVGAAGRFGGAGGTYTVRRVDDDALEFSFSDSLVV